MILNKTVCQACKYSDGKSNPLRFQERWNNDVVCCHDESEKFVLFLNTKTGEVMRFEKSTWITIKGFGWRCPLEMEHLLANQE